MRSLPLKEKCEDSSGEDAEDGRRGEARVHHRKRLMKKSFSHGKRCLGGGCKDKKMKERAEEGNLQASLRNKGEVISCGVLCGGKHMSLHGMWKKWQKDELPRGSQTQGGMGQSAHGRMKQGTNAAQK